MEPKEPIETRKQMAEMHESVINRIESAYRNGQYIEVCWLCYACFESRINRTLIKMIPGCSRPVRQDGRSIGITTKLECYARLIKSGYPLLKGEDINLINIVKGWCAERNKLIHEMVTLENYKNIDKSFENLAKRGKALVHRLYSLSTDVRESFYSANTIPPFNDSVMKPCKLKCRCIKE